MELKRRGLRNIAIGISTLAAVTVGICGYAALDGFRIYLLDVLATWVWLCLLFCVATLALGRVRQAWHFLIWPFVTILTVLIAPYVADAYVQAALGLSLRTGYEFEISEAFGGTFLAISLVNCLIAVFAQAVIYIWDVLEGKSETDGRARE